MIQKRFLIGCFAFFTVLFIAPPLAYYIFIGSVPSINPKEAYTKLTAPDTRAVLADIRSDDEFNLRRIKGSIHWSTRDIMNISSLSGMPEQFTDRPVFLICESGISSAEAANRLRSLGHKEAYSVEGGISLWTGKVRPKDSGSAVFTSFENDRDTVTTFPEKQIKPSLQYMLWIIAGVIKPFYMFLSFILIILFRHHSGTGSRTIRWGLIAFLAGESFCAINFLVFKDASLLLEYLHVYGMVLFYALLLYAAASTLEKKFFHSLEPDRHCALLTFCGTCWKQNSTLTCRLRIIYDITVVFLIVLSFMPLLAENRPISYNTMVLGDPVHLYQPMAIQLAESKLFPVIAVLLLLIALVINRFKGEQARELATIIFSMGVGYLGFGLFRLILETLFGDAFWWFSFWEEFTELLFIGAIGIILYLFKKPSLRTAETR